MIGGGLSSPHAKFLRLLPNVQQTVGDFYRGRDLSLGEVAENRVDLGQQGIYVQGVDHFLPPNRAAAMRRSRPNIWRMSALFSPRIVGADAW